MDSRAELRGVIPTLPAYSGDHGCPLPGSWQASGALRGWSPGLERGGEEKTGKSVTGPQPPGPHPLGQRGSQRQCKLPGTGSFLSLKKKNYLVTPGLRCSMRDLYLQHMNSELQHVRSSSPTRDRTQAPTLGAWSLSHWTPRKVPVYRPCLCPDLLCDLGQVPSPPLASLSRS